MHDFDPSLLVFGLANSGLVEAARNAGLVAIEEVFADRGYRADGSLVPRKEPGALLDDENVVLDRTLAMVREQRVQAVSGEWVPLNAQTICLHGDGAHALAFARRIRGALDGGGHRSARGARQLIAQFEAEALNAPRNSRGVLAKAAVEPSSQTGAHAAHRTRPHRDMTSTVWRSHGEPQSIYGR